MVPLLLTVSPACNTELSPTTPGAAVADADLWDDNPSEIDLLGFDAVVAPVLAAIGEPNLDPVTIGIHGPWGGGKSTVLGLICKAVVANPTYLVLRMDPWEFDGDLDVRGTLIAEVLGALETQFADDSTVTEKTAALLKRISWSRVGMALTKGAFTMQWDLEKLVEAFTPKAKEVPESMTGFRSSFKELLDALPGIERVVVLVDDLDRCLPRAVTATLEAIKLFLSVPKMVFVIAADQDMVRDAIAVSIEGASRGDRFAKRYLEKIIQLPISLPRLAPHEAESYTAMLLARAACTNDAHYTALVSHCRDRRQAQQHPLMDDLARLPWQPDGALLSLAAQFSEGLSSDRVSNPRQVKRFLNAFGVRQQIAISRGITVTPAVIGKVLLLEDRYRDDFDVLAGTPQVDRAALIESWEGWAHGEEAFPERPAAISEASRAWAASDPRLASVEMGPYITLAATLVAAPLGGDLSDDLSLLVARLLGSSEADRGLAQDQLASRPVGERRQVVAELRARARRLQDFPVVVEALVGIASRTADVVAEVVSGIRQECWHHLDPGSVVDIGRSKIPELVAVLPELAADTNLAPDVREVARQEQEY